MSKQKTYADLDRVEQDDWVADSQTKEPSTVDVDVTAPYRVTLDTQPRQPTTDFTAPIEILWTLSHDNLPQTSLPLIEILWTYLYQHHLTAPHTSS